MSVQPQTTQKLDKHAKKKRCAHWSKLN